MAADYREQYRPDQLEPFWPNEILKMAVVVLCTLAVIMTFAVLPVVLEVTGITAAEHHEEPANPRGATPTIVIVTPFTIIGSLSTPALPPNRVCQ